jgi:lipoprotein signal peptidase
LLADQASKALADRAGLVAHNPDYALGVVGGPAPALIAGTAVVLVAFLALVARRAVQLGVSPLIPAVIAAGMVGNALDRMRFGGARDFVTTPWAIVNLADIAIAAGVLVFAATLAVHVYRTRVAQPGFADNRA